MIKSNSNTARQTAVSDEYAVSEESSSRTNDIENLTYAFIKFMDKSYDGLSYEKLYRNSYNIVLNGNSIEFHNIFKDLLAKRLEGVVKKKLEENMITHFLNTLKTEYEDILFVAVLSRETMLYFENNFLKKEGFMNLYDETLTLFRENVFGETIKKKTFTQVMQMITEERNGGAIDVSLVKSVIDILLALDLSSKRKFYVDVFEIGFLEQSEVFYRNEVQELLKVNNGITYIRKFKSRVSEEKSRCERYLSKETTPLIVDVVIKTMIKEHAVEIVQLDEGLAFMLNKNLTNDIVLLHKYFCDYVDVDIMLKAIAECFCREGRDIVKPEAENSPLKMIESILNLNHKYKSLIEDHKIDKNDLLKNSLEDSFRVLVNQYEKMSEYLALYLHTNLTKGKNTSETNADKISSKSMELFKYLSERDKFEAYYRRYMTTRFTKQKYISIDVEKIFISKLKEKEGASYTSKLEALIKDLVTSDVHMEIFRDFRNREEQILNGIDLSVMVFCQGSWPFSASISPCVIPDDPLFAWKAYERCYIDKHTGKKLKLMANYGSASVVLNLEAVTVETEKGAKNYAKRVYVLEVSTFQMCTMLLFNKRNSFTLQEIKEQSQIEEKSLINALRSLLTAGQKIFCKSGSFSELKDEDIFTINNSFTSKNSRVKIRPLTKKNCNEVDEETERIEKALYRERSDLLKLAIVRIMKARKTLEHNLLLVEVMGQLNTRFKPEVKMISQQIEILCDKEYITKMSTTEGEVATTSYQYVA